jgi:hypothetical protein
MKRILPVLLISFAVLCSKSGNDLSGTATDANSGSIAGLVLNKGEKYQDSVTVSLYSGDSILAKRTVSSANPSKTMLTANGQFKFDSLSAGTYSIRVTKDSLVVGQQLGIDLSKGENKTVNITIVIIINQTFNITNINNNQNITINNYYFTGGNGMLDATAAGHLVATFTERDTLYVTINLTTAGVTDTVTLAFVKQQDGTYSSLPVKTALPIAVSDGATVVNSGTGSNSSTVKIDGIVKEETR